MTILSLRDGNMYPGNSRAKSSPMAPAQLRVARNGFEHAVNLLWKKGDRFRNRLDPLFWVSAPLCRAAEAHKLSYRSFRRFAIAMPYFGQKIKSTLHKERALRSVDLTKQTITLVIRIIAAFCDGYVKKQFASMNKMRTPHKPDTCLLYTSPSPRDCS